MPLRRLSILAVVAIFALLLSQCEVPEVTSAKVYLQQNNPKAAEEQLLLAIQKYPDNAQAAWLLAVNIYRPQKKYDKAVEMGKKAKTLDPKYEKEYELLVRSVWAEMHTMGANLFNDAIRAFLPADRDSLLKEAAKQFELALQYNDTARLTYNGLIKAYYLLKDTANVIKFSRQMFAKNLMDPEILQFYYEVRWTKGEEESVLEELKNAIAKYPKSEKLHILYITRLAEMERFETALEDCKKLLANDPNNLDYIFLLAQLYNKVGNYEEAKYLYQKVLAENPNNLDILTRAAENTFLNKDYVTSEEYARRIIQIDPENAFGYEVLWKSLYNQGKREEAEKYRQIARQLR